jgi:hypothetical protein
MVIIAAPNPFDLIQVGLFLLIDVENDSPYKIGFSA